ncbi:hypothetical protein F4859DRAFT_54799, partial [Xylaria cf. heliscus]
VSNLPIAFKSQRACSSCRKWKKQCDKTIPRCTRCVQKSIICDYTAPTDDHFVYNERSRLEITATTEIVELWADGCPSLTGVGWGLLFEAAGNPANIHGEAARLTAVIQRILKASGINHDDAASKFIATIHPWFPILNRETLTRLINLPKHGCSDGLSTFLLLCMHILNQTPCQNQLHMTNNSLYLVARRLFFLLQDTRTQSPEEFLQAGILITLYECSHGIWDAAYVTLANCIALSQLAGMSYVDSFSVYGNTLANTCHWAVMLLDRLLSLLNSDNPHPSLLTYNGSQYDISWLSGLGSSAAVDEVCCGFPELIKLHATAQTAYNLGDALRYIVNNKGGVATMQCFDSIDASTTKLIDELVLMSQNQPLRLCDATAFAISVLVSLRRSDYLRQPQQMGVNSVKLSSLHSSLNMVHETVRATTDMTINRQIGDHSFIGIVSVLRAAVHLVAARGRDLDIKDWGEIEDLLLRFSKRWGIGVQLLKEFTQKKKSTWPELFGEPVNIR